MKKTIAILMILVLAGVGLFAAPAAAFSTSPINFTLTTTVFELNLFKITTADLSADSLFTAFVTKASDSVTSRAVDANDGITATYLTMGTNSTSGFTVQVDKATTKLASDTVGVSTEIDYTISCNGNDYNTKSNPAANVDLLTVSRTAGSPAEVTSKAITVVIDAESYQNAAQATDYKAIVKFVIKGA